MEETIELFVAAGALSCRGSRGRVEILLRLGAHADRPRDFLRDPWNLFDLVVVLCAFLPLVRENTTVLRLLRLARVLRTARFLPQLRIVLTAVARSLPGTLSFLLAGALLLYVYAMVGWVFFGRHDPEHYGSIGRGVVITSLDEARQMEQEEATEEPPYPAPGLEDRRLLITRITAARQALDDLERDLLQSAAADGSPDIGAAPAAFRS
ncbi:ion transporter [Streptomyces hyaluromycini]|uniref:Ion transporter n=1 Tax=Streptomyces hyaluromycini TaxID=1377993 RepID=A0ABV1WRV1_9ACTN